MRQFDEIAIRSWEREHNLMPPCVWDGVSMVSADILEIAGWGSCAKFENPGAKISSTLTEYYND